MRSEASRQDLAFPITIIPSLTQPVKIEENPEVVRQSILGALMGAHQLKTPIEAREWDPNYGKKQKASVSEEQIQLVINLIESLGKCY